MQCISKLLRVLTFKVKQKELAKGKYTYFDKHLVLQQNNISLTYWVWSPFGWMTSSLFDDIH
jgi:hypothetical protein